MKFPKILFLSLLAVIFLASGAFAADKKAAEKPAAALPAKPWSVRCAKDTKDTEPKRGRCEIYQRLVVKESGKRFVEAAISYPKDKPNARGVFVVPLGILLQPGMQMKIDDGKPFKFQARYCDGNGCWGFVDLNDQILDSLRKGTKLTLAFQAINQKPINVEMTLKGFAEALKDISG